jgi:hypothetical protein
MALTPQERDRIVEEERVRAQARAQFAQPAKKAGQPAWYNRKLSCGLGCLVLFIVFIVLVALGSDRDDTSSPASPTPSPTATVEAAATAAVSPEEQVYLQEVQKISEQTTKSLTEMAELITTKPLPGLWTPQETLLLAANTVIIESAYTEANKLTVPARFQAVHTTWLRGLKKLADAMPLFRQGVDESNANKIEQAATMITEAGKDINQATEQLKALQ